MTDLYKGVRTAEAGEAEFEYKQDQSEDLLDRIRNQSTNELKKINYSENLITK